jgi:hypothetical protein
MVEQVNTRELLVVYLRLLALKSFEQEKGPYMGYLSFESKTELIELCKQKYGATLGDGTKDVH